VATVRALAGAAIGVCHQYTLASVRAAWHALPLVQAAVATGCCDSCPSKHADFAQQQGKENSERKQGKEGSEENAATGREK